MEIIVKTLSGLEQVLADELKDLGANEIEIMHRAVKCHGNEKTLYRCNLELRTALRVLVPVTRFNATNEEEFYQGVQWLYWDKYITNGKTIAVDAVVSSDHFNHSHYMALKTKDAIVDQLRNRRGSRPDVDVTNADIRINTHIYQDKCTISLDSSGQSLHKRGYRISAVSAPINEVLAAGLLRLAGYKGNRNFIDPMCGSGTFLCEAAFLAMNKPPHAYEKEFSFMHWKDFNRKAWEEVVNNCKKYEKPLNVVISGFDKIRRAVHASEFNIAEAGLKEQVQVSKMDLFSNNDIPQGSLVIMNPPYDQRLKHEDIVSFYQQIGDHMKNNMAGSEIWIFSSNIEALKLLGLKPNKKFNLYNGPNPAKFHKFEIYEGKKPTN